MKKTITITWGEDNRISCTMPEVTTSTYEILGALEMCKLLVFENKQKAEE